MEVVAVAAILLGNVAIGRSILVDERGNAGDAGGR